MSRFFSNSLKDLVPYTPGEQIAGKFIKLNTNESPFPPSPMVLNKVCVEEIEKLNLYSDPSASFLVNSIANYYGIKKENVAVGNGSDEILAFIFRGFGDNGFVCPSVTYGFYPVFAKFFGIDLETVPMKEDLSIDLKKFFDSKKNIIIANPNAQTGTYICLEEIEKLVAYDRNRLVVIDEAYIDFGGESAVSLVDKYDNLIVVQTFSKSRNLAGGRIGFAIGCESLISDINTLRFSFNPYNVNRLSIIAGAYAMKDKEYFKFCIKEIVSAREETKLEIKNMGFDFPNSMSNFILMKHSNISGKELYLKLKERGILVRYLGGEISEYIRVTIGSKKQMKQFVLETKNILGGIL